MKDGLGRTIEYLRISVTDRCNLRCVYCMPEGGLKPMRHADILRYEEIARLVRIFASLGVKKLRLTGGEPLVRRNLDTLVSMLKRIDGIERVALTTNGLLLSEQLPGLIKAGLDAVNISLDTIDAATFCAITRGEGLERVTAAIEACARVPNLAVKLNCVPTIQNAEELCDLVSYANGLGVLLRFIELMPIGPGRAMKGLPEAEVLERLTARFGAWTPEPDTAGEKCRVFCCGDLRVGFISPMTHRFCSRCDRIRLTSDGKLKTCLEYPPVLDLRAMLSEPDEAIRAAMMQAIQNKPAAHRFSERAADTDPREMVQIGG